MNLKSSLFQIQYSQWVLVKAEMKQELKENTTGIKYLCMHSVLVITILLIIIKTIRVIDYCL